MVNPLSGVLVSLLLYVIVMYLLGLHRWWPGESDHLESLLSNLDQNYLVEASRNMSRFDKISNTQCCCLL